MTIIFKAKTPEAYHIKIMIEILANNIKTGCFEVDEDGISLCMMDQHRKTLINLILNAENFALYKFTSDKMYLGINLNHLHKMLKSIKKKDSIELFIDDASPTELNIRVIPKENNRTTTSTVKIQNIQNLVIDIPTGYGKPITVVSSDYSKMTKELNSISNIINVSAKNHSIKFACDAGSILKRAVRLGDYEEDDDDSKDTYAQEFYSEQLCRITKISGLSTNIKIYIGKPLMLSSNIGGLGKIDVYIKSKEQIESEISIDQEVDSFDSD